MFRSFSSSLHSATNSDVMWLCLVDSFVSFCSVSSQLANADGPASIIVLSILTSDSVARALNTISSKRDQVAATRPMASKCDFVSRRYMSVFLRGISLHLTF
jgi:hypothetical protein